MSWHRNGAGPSRQPHQTAQPLERVAPGPWRSRGQYLDYEKFADRDRFLELDARITRHAAVYGDPEKEQRNREILALREEGMQYVAIADALGISRNIVHAVLKRAREKQAQS